ncbi:hypothetical protein COEREDRAFT_89032 [Coemansia reversa NRRL 1564]|uniref:Uncharacterized protein n=1 Tax=Coemansia reversa (strain ATCC 12441 / NRRL 1564) TaxID=763665 RepID=A0A2G5B503_COERN|nr:hypothetical protein COEREDRAFT_89032 [Coemansia reversa NRRL 1564]|eukprot:PIA14080.1 hypothetical protein COEREDRAFT_89032 [Coemansia reversa NRRL 1564]
MQTTTDAEEVKVKLKETFTRKITKTLTCEAPNYDDLNELEYHIQALEGFGKKIDKNYIANSTSLRSREGCEFGPSDNVIKTWTEYLVYVIEIFPWEPIDFQHYSQLDFHKMANASVKERFTNFADRLKMDLKDYYDDCISCEFTAKCFEEGALTFLANMDWSLDKEGYDKKNYISRIPKPEKRDANHDVSTEVYDRFTRTVDQEIQRVLDVINTDQKEKSPATLVEESASKLKEVDWKNLVASPNTT